MQASQHIATLQPPSTVLPQLQHSIARLQTCIRHVKGQLTYGSTAPASDLMMRAAWLLDRWRRLDALSGLSAPVSAALLVALLVTADTTGLPALAEVAPLAVARRGVTQGRTLRFSASREPLLTERRRRAGTNESLRSAARSCRQENEWRSGELSALLSACDCLRASTGGMRQGCDVGLPPLWCACRGSSLKKADRVCELWSSASENGPACAGLAAAAGSENGLSTSMHPLAESGGLMSCAKVKLGAVPLPIAAAVVLRDGKLCKERLSPWLSLVSLHVDTSRFSSNTRSTGQVVVAAVHRVRLQGSVENIVLQVTYILLNVRYFD